MPQWYADSAAFPLVLANDRSTPQRYETLMTEALDGRRSFFAKREVIDEYGWRHYGDVYADHENAHYPGTKPVVSHYNNQYDVVYGMLLQFFRTGDPRWFTLADDLARHVIDIDIYHTNEDRAVYNGGLFWHTDHYRDAASCTHRGYSRANRRRGRPYGGGPGNTHNYTSGLLLHYYLTGYPAVRDAVLSLANWVITMDDGNRHVLGCIDDGPTGLATHNGEPAFVGPGRGSGNSVNALLDAWLLTGDRKYLQKAEEFIQRVIHPDDNVASRDLLNVEPRWSYTVFLTVLARYLEVKREHGDFGFMYDYARASLVHYAAWMVENERPYFDQVEKLEFPTEAWTVHDRRKANVMRFAAAHTDEPLRGRLLQRAHEFSERSWTDLMGFESRTSARALAIMMVEGAKDVFFRTKSVDRIPHEGDRCDFGCPRTFVYQKLRVGEQLKSFRGLARAARRAISFHYLSTLRRWLP